MRRSGAVAELKAVYAVLKDDFDRAKLAVTVDPSEFHKRSLVRAAFALIEGFSFHLRQVTLATLKDTSFLTEGDRAILREERYQLSANGTPETRDNFQRTLPMILFSLRVYAKNHGAAFTPDTSDSGWNCLRKAVDIRDRVTHPKALGDLQITDDLGSTFSEGVRWWNEALGELLRACEAADKKFVTLQGTQS